MRWLLLTAFLLLPSGGEGKEVPYLAGRVNDHAGMLSASAVSELELLLKTHEDSTSNQIAVLLVPDLEGEDLESYSLKVAETWKLGQEEKDNGVLLLIVRDERLVRIEVGSGLEGALTDAVSGRIIRGEIVPRFRDGDFDGGVRGAVNAIIGTIAGEYVAEPDEVDSEDLASRLVAGLVFLVVVGVFTLIALVSSGFASWFLFVFLIPFWLVFPNFILGPPFGMLPIVVYVVGFLLFKVWLARSGKGKSLSKKWATLGASSGGWSSRSGSFSSGWSSGGSSFSGGGGSFSGGGASGSW
jgi:uncharacterized protein